MNALLRSACLGLGLLALPLSASAQMALNLSGLSSNPNAPIEVTSEALNIDQATNIATFTGDVLIVQETTRISAQTAVAYYDAQSGEIIKIDLDGGVTLATPTDAAESQSAQYDLRSQKLLLLGNVLVVQGPSIAKADRMDIDLATGGAQLDGRVSTVFGGRP